MVSSFTPRRGAGRDIDVAKTGAELLHRLEARRGGEIVRADVKRLDDQGAAHPSELARISSCESTMRTSAG